MSARARLRRVAPALAALASGAVLPLALAPAAWWPVAVLSPAMLLALLSNCSARTALLRGWLFGLGLFGAGTSWVYVSIHTYGAAPVPLAALLTLLFCAGLALFPALSAWLWVRRLRDRPGGTLLGFPAVWLLGEWLRGWVLTGFPWLYLGYSQIDGPLAGWAPVVGVFGTGLILVFGSAVLVIALAPLCNSLWAAIERRPRAATDGAQGALLPRSPPRVAVLVAAALWLAAWPLAQIEWTAPLGGPRSVALVQGNIPQLIKWEPDHLDNTLAIYRDLSEPLWGIDFVVWPESAVPAYFDLVTGYLSTQAVRAATSGSALLLGIPTRNAGRTDADYDTFNSVVALGADSGRYDKRRLVPFGEYVPLEGVLRGLIAFFDLPMSGFARGAEEQPLLGAHGMRIGTFICYEIAYPDLVRTALPEAALLLTVSNDTWFGASIGPLQHLDIARMRALENGRDLVRATNDGVSALVDARGRITARGARFTREVVRGSVQPRTGLTPFARFGSWPVLLLGALMLLVPLVARRRST